MDSFDRAQFDALRAEVRSIDSAVRGVHTDMRVVSKQLETIEKALGDHEGRLRSVERWKLSIPISMLLAIATIASAVLARGTI